MSYSKLRFDFVSLFPGQFLGSSNEQGIIKFSILNVWLKLYLFRIKKWHFKVEACMLFVKQKYKV